MPGVIVVYLGLITMFLGGVSVLKPLRFLAIGSRWQALAVMAVGLVVVVIGASLPSQEIRVAAARTQLDQFVPAYQFNEFHSVRIAPPKDKVYAALKQVNAGEDFFLPYPGMVAPPGTAGTGKHPQSAAKHAAD
jgi:hypothetical protein